MLYSIHGQHHLIEIKNGGHYDEKVARKRNLEPGRVQEVVREAGFSEEWESADGDTFEAIVYRAAEILSREV